MWRVVTCKQICASWNRREIMKSEADTWKAYRKSRAFNWSSSTRTSPTTQSEMNCQNSFSTIPCLRGEVGSLLIEMMAHLVIALRLQAADAHVCSTVRAHNNLSTKAGRANSTIQVSSLNTQPDTNGSATWNVNAPERQRTTLHYN